MKKKSVKIRVNPWLKRIGENKMKRFGLIFLLLCGLSAAATFTAATVAGDGDWDDPNSWSKTGDPAVEGTDYPGPNDSVDLNGETVAINIATCPSTGTLALIYSGETNNSAGKLTVNLTTGNFAIACTTIQAGTNTGGIIAVSGGTNTLTITTGTSAGQGVIGGTATNAHGVVNAATSGVVVITKVTGSATVAAYGVNNASTGTVTVTTSTGGGFAAAYGTNNASTGTVNVTTATGSTATTTHGVNNAVAGTANVVSATGSATATANGIRNAGAGTVNVTTATAGAGASAHGVYNVSTGTVNVVNAVGGTADSANGVNNSNGTGVVNVTGNLIFVQGKSFPLGGFVSRMTTGNGNYIKFPSSATTTQNYYNIHTNLFGPYGRLLGH